MSGQEAAPAAATLAEVRDESPACISHPCLIKKLLLQLLLQLRSDPCDVTYLKSQCTQFTIDDNKP